MDPKETKLEAAVRELESGVSPEAAAKLAELLEHGEELFGAGRYQEAVHVWTRILFSDRGNAEAREAIDRAKRALAERQRQLEVEVFSARQALEAGRLEEAKTRLRAVLAVDPRHGEASQLDERIAVLERRSEIGSRLTSPVTSSPRTIPRRGLLLRVRNRSLTTVRMDRSPLKLVAFAAATLMLFGAGALYLYLNWEMLVGEEALTSAPSGASERASSGERLVAPGSAELRYYNGVRLFEKGRYREALAELGRVERSSPVFERARSLVLRIEERLLRGAPESESSGGSVDEES